MGHLNQWSLAFWWKTDIYNYYNVQNAYIFVGRTLFRRGDGFRKFRPVAEIIGIFSIEVAPKVGRVFEP